MICKWCNYGYILSPDGLQCTSGKMPTACQFAEYDPTDGTKIICKYCYGGYALNRVDNSCLLTASIAGCQYM